MKSLNRREFFKIAGGMVAATALAGCSPAQGLLPPLYPEPATWPAEPTTAAWRALNRITFGPRLEDRQRAAEIGLAAFIEEQLAPDTLADMPPGPYLAWRRLETLHLDAPDLFDGAEEAVTQELQKATLLRAIYSGRQLAEIMVDFWSNHFNIAQTKGDCAWLKTVDDREVIRPHALGNFKELLYASSHSPAMLIYLDNQENYAGNPNENYARELLELHTLGIEGGYTQKDVQELARCLTGWTVKDHFYRGQFEFQVNQHDDGPKQILDVSLPAGSKQAGGEQIIERLAAHPATARFIATKLVRRFIADRPPQALVQRAAQTFLQSQGDIKAVLRAILLSPDFLDEPAAGHAPSLKLKRPLEFMASALRQLYAQTDTGPALLQYLAEMGQPLFQWPTPDGYPDYAEAWSGTLLARWRFALALAQGQIPGVQVDLPGLVAAAPGEAPEQRLAQLAALLLGQPLDLATARQLVQTHQLDSEPLMAATLLGSPAFQWR